MMSRFCKFIIIPMMAFFCAPRVCAQERGDIINRELTCVAQSLESGEGISWNDICYTWQAPQEAERDQLVNDALDAYEKRPGKRADSSPPETPRWSSSQKAVAQSQLTKSEKEKARDEEIEAWLQNEYPYFYQEHKRKNERKKVYYGDDYREDSKIWSFMKNIDYGVVFQSEVEPIYYFETVFPVYQSEEKKHTLFSHDRISVVSDQDGSYSAGLGYRFYNEDFPYIFGVNTFYDYEQGGDHYRMGYGAEFIREDVEARVNYYDALSPAKFINAALDTGGRIQTYEKAVDGFDFEFGVTVPSFPLAKVFGGYQWYDFEQSDDRQGWTSRLELKPSPSVTLNFEIIDEQNQDKRYRFDGRLNFAFSTFDPKDIMADIKGESAEPVRIDFEDRLLDRVERDFTIRKERWNEQTGPQTVILQARFPGQVCGACDDLNMNGVADPNEGFELDVVFTNNTNLTATTIIATNVTFSDTMDFNDANGAINTLPAAAPGQTVLTDTSTDFDVEILASATAGQKLFISFDLTVDGVTTPYMFGPFVVGSVFDGQKFK